MLTAVIWIGTSLGGISQANTQGFEMHPDLFSRAGKDNYFTPQKWLSFCLLWIACVPMFPQLFMRFFIAKDIRTFKRSAVLYALIPCFLFILPVMIGIMGHLTFPGTGG